MFNPRWSKVAVRAVLAIACAGLTGSAAVAAEAPFGLAERDGPYDATRSATVRELGDAPSSRVRLDRALPGKADRARLHGTRDAGRSASIDAVAPASGHDVVTLRDGDRLTRVPLSRLGGCAASGDAPVSFRDRDADRWVIARPIADDRLCLLVSVTPDPSGAWFIYDLHAPGVPSRPKLARQGDWYLLGTAGAAAPSHALEAEATLAGAPVDLHRSNESTATATSSSGTPDPAAYLRYIDDQTKVDAAASTSGSSGVSSASDVDDRLAFDAISSSRAGASSASGPMPISLGDDDSEPITLPFSFPFCGESYDTVFVGSNGYLTFGGGDTDFSESNTELLSQEPRIAALWDDLAPHNGGSVTWEEPAPGEFRVDFVGVPEFLNTGSNTFAIILRDDGTHTIEYGAISANDGLAGRSPGGNLVPDPGETDLSAAAAPIGATEPVVYERFTAADNDLDGLTLDFAPCPQPGLLSLGDDDFEEVDLPFTFPFCGADHDTVFVGSNGFLTFGAGDTDLSESAFDLVNGPPRIAGLWDDLAPNQGGEIYAIPSGPNMEIGFRDVPEWFSGNSNTFTFTLRPDGTHSVDYGGIDTDDAIAGRSSGFGAVDPGATDLSAEPSPIGPADPTIYEQWPFIPIDLAGTQLDYAACPLDAPLIDVTPPSIASVQESYTATQHPVDVYSIGTRDLIYTIEEANAPAPASVVEGIVDGGDGPIEFGRASAGRDSDRTASTTDAGDAVVFGPAATPTSRAALINPILDPGFELGRPNPVWAEFSSFFDSPICSAILCGTGTGTGPANGDYWVWIGGVGTNATASVSQIVTIPSGVTDLHFNYEAIVCDSPSDYWEILIDGVSLFGPVTSAHPTFGPRCGVLGYESYSVDVSAFADDLPHVIEIRGEIFAANGGPSNFFFDDIVLDGTCVTPTDISWLSIGPVTGGTLPPGTTQPLTVTIDTTGLDCGIYDALVCIESNDPVTPLVELPVSVDVINLPPVVDAGDACVLVDEGELWTQDGSFTDNGPPASWTGSVDYGAGAGLQPLALTLAKTFTLSNVYATEGIYTAVPFVVDHKGLSGSDPVLVQVQNLDPFFSIDPTQFLEGVNRFEEDVLVIPSAGAPIDQFVPGFLSSAVTNLDALDVLPNGDVLFSVRPTRTVADGAGGTIQLLEGRLYRLSGGVITEDADWGTLAITNLDAVDRLADGTYAISTDTTQYVSIGGALVRVWHNRVYQYDPVAETLVELWQAPFNLPNLDAVDLLTDGRVVFSTSTSPFVSTPGGLLRLWAANLYVWDPDTGDVELFFDGVARGIQGMDATSLGSVGGEYGEDCLAID